MSERYERLSHPFAPVWDERSRVLILGTFPSVRSRGEGFYYGHPQNRFWRVMAAVLGAETPQTVARKRELLLQNGVALWDVLASCEIVGSSDQSIRKAVPNDIAALIAKVGIARVYANGSKAGELYRRYAEVACGIPATVLPSTSPANAAWSLDKLIEAWRAVI